MNKKVTLFVAFVSLLFANYVLADNFKASLSQSDIVLNFSVSGVYNLTVQNQQNNSLYFSVSAKGDAPKGIFFSNSIFVPALADSNFLITIKPDEDLGIFNFTIDGETANGTNKFSVPVSLWVQHPDKYLVKGFKYSVENKKATASLILKPDRKMQTEVSFDVIDINEKVVKSASASIEMEKEGTVSQGIDISDLTTGKYKLAAAVKGTSIRKVIDFDVGIEKSVTEEKSITPGLLFDEVKITLRNYGNLIENDYKVYEDIGKNRFVTLLTNATDIIKSGNDLRYEFTIEKIRPGEVATIIYRLENWQNLAVAIVVIIVVIAVAVTAFLMNGRPRVHKKFVKRGRGQYSIMLEVKNSKLGNIKDVIVRDLVQPLVKIGKQETSGLAPHVRESQVGTELIWKIGPLQKGESRVLHYTLDALVHAESIKLTYATMSYVTSRNRRGKVASNELTLQ